MKQDKRLYFQNITSGRDKQGRGQGSPGACGGRGGGRGSRYSTNINNINNKDKGLCSALGQNVFDYGQKGALYKMRTTWDKIVNHDGTIYGHDISNAFKNKKRVDILQPEHTQKVKDMHLNIFERLRYQHSSLMPAREVKLKLLESEVQRQEDPEAPVKLAMLINDIDEATYQATVKPSINID